MDGDLRTLVERWIADDPDEDARNELRALLEADDEAELRDRFSGPLAFGTAGLRGLLGAGPRRMNRAVVARATAGVCAHLAAQDRGARGRGLCIGFDARHGSRELAEEAAAVAAGAGFRVLRFEDVVPTPVLAFAVLDRGAAGGVMVTASHNPPAYNGYKVYEGTGAQIVPPTDEAIAERIRLAGPARELPRSGPEARQREGMEETLGEPEIGRYLQGVHDLLPRPDLPRPLTLAHTALHGVGAPLVRRALRAAGFERVVEVPDQADPDPDFPTVPFPNPEEEGAMDRVLEVAREAEADLALANDPDADRLAAAVRDADGSYRVLTGNEIGCLLGHYLLTEGPKDGNRLVLSTVVSSPMLGAIAAAHGARHEQTLTGFKWIAGRARELESDEGLRFLFGYEEALGYCVGNLVHDKDGISAATVMADMAAWARSRGHTLIDELDDMARTHGLYVSRQVSVTDAERGGLDRIAAMMDTARAAPPERLGGFDVVAVQDVERGERRTAEGEVTPVALPRSDLLVIELADGHRAMLRPSGTEPKLKYYVDVRMPVAADEGVREARSRAEALLDSIVADLRAHVEE